MFEKGITGGVSMISKLYVKAYNKYIHEFYDLSKSSTFISYLDANNLYERGIRMSLPTHGFKWIEASELENWRNHSCILEVDLDTLRDFMIGITIIP